ncbi:hypothetical protein ABTG05_12700 [Acinetobacter baumannii]
MTIQTINLGTAPSGAGGDTFRSTGSKLNENFTNPSHAASRYVGTSPGNLTEVGAFGWGRKFNDGLVAKSKAYLDNMDNWRSGLDCYADSSLPGGYGNVIRLGFGTFEANRWLHDLFITTEGDLYLRHSTNSNVFGDSVAYLSKRNTTVDSNGFIKAASPIIHLYADKIQLNHEASEQEIIFEKLDVGHYLIKGSSGFAKEGWWIEIPTDTHGNKICAVEYQTLENGDLEIKTFKKKLNDEGDIVANLDAPIDIPNNANGEPRWIDIRLNSIKKTIVRKIPRTEKQPRMVQQVKYAPQLTYITKYEDLFDDEGKAVIVDGKNYKKPVTHIQTDQNGTPILSNQPVINENGEPVFEWVQAVDSEGNPVFDDVPVLDKDGNPIYDEVTYDPE